MTSLLDSIKVREHGSFHRVAILFTLAVAAVVAFWLQARANATVAKKK